MNRSTTLQNLLVTTIFVAWASVCAVQPAQPAPPGQPGQKLHDQLLREDIAKLASDARTKGDPIRAILFAQQKIGCAGCHRAGAKDLLGPDLTRLEKQPTDLQVIESLLKPSAAIADLYRTVSLQLDNGTRVSGRILSETQNAIKLREDSQERKVISIATASVEARRPNTKSAMPDGLGNLLADRQQFLDLSHYAMTLVAIGEQDALATTAERDLSTEVRGLALIETLRCRACHQQPKPITTTLGQRGPDLRWSARHVSPEYLVRFIENPQHVKPGTRMPQMLSGMAPAERKQRSLSLAHFVMSLAASQQAGAAQETSAPNSQDTLADREAARRGRETFHSVGCVACHLPRDEQGLETKPTDSEGGHVALGPLAGKHDLAGLIQFLENPLLARPSGLMPNMQLTHWEAVDIAQYLLLDDETVEPSRESFVVDEGLAAEGKEHFHQLGCVNCHPLKPAGERSDAGLRDVAAMKPQPKGCLSGKAGPHPVYDLSSRERDALLAALRAEDLSDNAHIEVTMAGLRCYACHRRDGVGGIADSLDQYFQTENPNLGPQGRIPPTLTGVGAKLKPKWLRQVLVSGRSIRPYVKTRMPRFGASNVSHLVDLFADADSLPPVQFAEFKDQKEMRTVGHQLTGTGGLNCVACHTYQLKPAGVMPGVDVTEMAERLQKSWFYHYMKAPQRLSNNTVMPSFWPGGRAIRQDVLAGDPDLQIEALWQYLLDGRQARQPRGVVVEPMELVAGDEAVMLRRSYPNVGKRGIGVGYPGQVNLVFDAEQMRLAMLWQGKFADPAGVWRSQGHGVVRPLSRDVMRFPPGPDLDDERHPWEVDDGRPPQHQFRGYRLDQRRRPTWNYRFRDVSVEDYFVDRKPDSDSKAYFERRVSLVSPSDHSGLRLRVAAGAKIESVGDNVFVVDDRLQIDADTAMQRIETEGAPKQLESRFHLEAGQTREFSIRYRWK